jgi:hypothetical protein
MAMLFRRTSMVAGCGLRAAGCGTVAAELKQEATDQAMLGGPRGLALLSVGPTRRENLTALHAAAHRCKWVCLLK